ncbi:MAG: UDP-N-acetylmuramoyl-L-alanine--D-glutamate ligase [Pseudomonadota bacterium]
MKNLKDLHVLILGLGASGLAMARWCARCGAHVTVADTREAPPNLDALRAGLPSARFIGGPFGAALLEGTEIRAMFVSPGLTPESVAPVTSVATSLGLWTGGELSLFSQALADLKAVPVEAVAEAVEAPEAAAAIDAGAEEDAAEVEPDASAHADADADEEPVDAQPAAANDDNADLPPVVPPAAPAETGYAPKILAITGTNGKTTVTALTGQLVERAGKSVAVAGNIGPTLLDTLTERLDANSLPEVWVIELSSFQLHGVSNFEPTAATVLNLTQDHLDWHGSMEAYGADKARVFGERSLMLLNREDPLVMAMLPAPVRIKGGKMVQRAHQTFGADMPQRPGDFGIETVNGMAWLVRALEADETRKFKKGEEEEIFFQRLMPADALRIRGRHNAVNALAALALAISAGCPLGPMLYGLREYKGEPHRVEPVAIINEVEYFDDSKGTNVGATVAALYGLGAERRVVVILGGDGKGQDFSPLAVPVQRHARGAVLIGRDGPQIREALAGTGVPLENAATMEEAVEVATRLAHAGDAVLMSPACASFDMFRNYPHRAEVFVAAVHALADRQGMMTEGSQ